MKLTWLLLICTVLFSQPASAAVKYVTFSAGAWLPENTTTVDNSFQPIDISYNAGWGLGGTIGVALDNGLRLENEIMYKQAAARRSTDDLWALGWMINVWWDARNSSPVTPYFGGGFGFGCGHAASPGAIDTTGTGVAYQAGGGFDIRLDRKLSLDLGYRYFGITDTSNNGPYGLDLVGSSFLTGLRVQF